MGALAEDLMSSANTSHVRPRPRRTQEQRRADTRARLIRGSISAIAERGYALLTIADITRHAGVTWGAAQHLFGDKSELMVQVVQAVSEQLLDQLAANKSWPKKLEERIPSVVRAMWDICRSRDFFALVEIIRGSRANPDMHDQIRHDQRAVVDRLESLWLTIFADVPANREQVLFACNHTYLSLIGLAGRKNYVIPDTDIQGMLEFIDQSAIYALSSSEPWCHRTTHAKRSPEPTS